MPITAREIVPTGGLVTWRSIAPGLLGLVGLVLHRTRHRGRWEVVVEPLDSRGDCGPPTWRTTVGSAAEVDAVVASVARRLRAGEQLQTD